MFIPINKDEWECIPYTDFMYKKGSNIQTDLLFNFLDISNLSTDELKDRYDKVIDYSLRNRTDKLFLEYDFSFLDLKETFDNNTRKRIKKVNNTKIYYMKNHSEIPLFGDMIFSRNEIYEYKLIKKYAIKCLYEPIVILSNPNACSKVFAIKTDSRIIFDGDNVTPVDIAINKIELEKWKKYRYSTSMRYFYATTFLAYIFERFFLNKVNATLANPRKYMLYLPNQYRRNNKNEFLMKDDTIGNIGKLDKFDITRIGLFEDYRVALLFYATMVDRSLSLYYPLKIDETNRYICLAGNEEKRIIELSKDITKILFCKQSLKNKNIPINLRKAFYDSLVSVNMNPNREYKRKSFVCIKIESPDNTGIIF